MSEDDATEVDPVVPAPEPSVRPPPVVTLGPLAPQAPSSMMPASSLPSAPPSASAMSSRSGASGAGSRSGARPPSTIAQSTVAAMHGEEATRAAGFGRVVAILCAVGLLAQLGYTGHPKLRIAMAIAQAFLGFVAAWVSWRARDPARWSKNVFRVFGLSAALASLVFILFLGPFSPVTVVVVMGLSFFGLGDDTRVVMPVAVGVAGGYMVSAILVTYGVVPDLGVFVPRGDVPRVARIAMLGMVTGTMLMQLWQARLGRRATMEAIERSNEAVRLARTREAQLEEAKENLDAAIRAGAGKSGRYTGTLAGRFRLEHIVGRGAMGEVYSARTDAGDRAAVKLLHIGKLEEPELVSRFLREAEVAQRVRGPNLVSVLEVGNAQDGSPFIAMELLEGGDLATLLRDRPNLSVAEVVTLVDDVARGLEVLHAAGVVHRDLKPANLFLSQGPPAKWKILDYGVSKLRESTMTEDQVVGTPGYMSPEQAQGGKVDGRSDIFALGAVAYRTITGRRPFTGTGTPQLLYQVVYGQPVRPREIMASLPRDIELVLAIALAKRPEARFPSGPAFATAMRLAAQNALDPKMRTHAERILRAAPWSKLAG